MATKKVSPTCIKGLRIQRKLSSSSQFNAWKVVVHKHWKNRWIDVEREREREREIGLVLRMELMESAINKWKKSRESSSQREGGKVGKVLSQKSNAWKVWK